jgi:hypothetical protein
MHNLHQNFNNILIIVKKSLKELCDNSGNIRKMGRKPKFSDAEVITLSILAECLMINSENYLFQKLNKIKVLMPHLIDRSNFNRRRRQLSNYTDLVRRHLVAKLTLGENTFIIDSMPLPICRFSRARRIKICKQEYQNAPDFGFCAAQNLPFYGYKLHSISSLDGVITHFDLTKAQVADIHFLKDVKDQYKNCLLLGDKAYLSNPMQTELFQDYKLLLNTPKRINQKNYVKQPVLFRKVRKRIETIFSQLCDQFQIQQNYAKSFYGLATRILAKITGYTMLQYLNKYSLNNQLCHVKHAIL